MKYKYLSTIGLLSMLLSVPIMATEAKSIPVEETFTAENIQNTISYSNNQLYMISAANELKAVGVNIKGINSTPFITSKWHSIKESTTGTAIKNVVQVKSTKIGEGGVYFLDALSYFYEPKLYFL